MTWKPDCIIYHDPCDDGFACAWIANRKWPGVTSIPTNYGRAIDFKGFRGQNVLIADFSFSADELITLGEIANSVIVLDHHKTAQANLAGFEVDWLSNCETFLTTAVSHYIFAKFDMDKSGAALTWDFCFPNEPMPVMLQFIEDRDLFRFKLKETKPFTYFLRSFPKKLEIWDSINSSLMSEPNLVIGQGLAIERYHNRLVNNIADTATQRKFGKWDKVAVAHAPYDMISDLGHELLKRYYDAPFAAVAVVAYGERTWSLRSEDSRMDVSEVAKSYGGGGHRNAAGFRVPT